MEIQSMLWGIFAFVIVGFLVLDLGYFNRQAHRISANSAFWQSMFWIALSLVYAALIYYWEGQILAVEFLSAYVTEKLLSVDNLFVILLIFDYFKLEEKYFHKVLFWGIMGAIVFRAIFILLGAAIVENFHFVLYIFGAILIYTGWKLLGEKKEQHIDYRKSWVFRSAHKIFSFTTNPHGGKFFVVENGKRMATLLFLIVIMVESTDIIFAIDSIPAAFAISQSPFILFTSNIFAIMGLRALFFLIENVTKKFHHLQKALSFILIFVGAKMLADMFGFHLSSLVSFAIIMSLLGGAIILSLLFPKKI